MNKRVFIGLVIAFALTGTTIAATFPSYYPKEGFQRTGKVDAVYFEQNTVVINDVPYQLSKSPIVHALNSYSVSIARIRPGIVVAYRTGANRMIEEFWLLPSDYDPRERR